MIRLHEKSYKSGDTIIWLIYDKRYYNKGNYSKGCLLVTDQGIRGFVSEFGAWDSRRAVVFSRVQERPGPLLTTKPQKSRTPDPP